MPADVAPKDFSSTASSNTQVGGINVAEGMQATQINDAIRAILAVFANSDFGTGSAFKVDAIAESTADTGVTIDGLLIKDGGFPSAVLSTLFPDIDFSGLAMTGDYKPTSRTTADTGWKMCNGDTLGSAASSADQASDDHEALFLHLWNRFDNAQLAVTGGRGASAAADWAANKVIALPNFNNRMPVGAGDNYVNGKTGGEATHLLTAAESGLPAHDHDIPAQTGAESGGPVNTRLSTGDTAGSPMTFTGMANNSAQNASQAHNNMPPYIGVYWQIKL